MFIFTKKFRKLCIQYPLFLYILVENFTEYILVKNLGQTIETIYRIIKNKKIGSFYLEPPNNINKHSYKSQDKSEHAFIQMKNAFKILVQ